MFKYDYDMLTDFPNAYNPELPFPYGISISVLQSEVSSGIRERLLYINAEEKDDTVSVVFEKQLSSESEAKLDEIVSEHTGTCENLPQTKLLEYGTCNDIHIMFGGGSESQNYWQTRQTTWTVARTFWFPGTNNTGTPVVCAFVCNLSNNVIGYVRLVDITNNKVICDLTVPSGTTNQKVFGAIPYDFPQDGAIIQIQASVSVFNRYIYLYSFLMSF